MEELVERELAGETEELRKIYLSATLYTTNPILPHWKLNWELQIFASLVSASNQIIWF
jgi:hypothetical protein